jgi:hypothetical protein
VPVMALSVSKSARHCGAKRRLTVDGVTTITACIATVHLILISDS